MSRGILLPIALCVLASTCDDAVGPGGPPGGVQEPIETLPRELSPQELVLIDAGNDFTFDLFGRLVREEPDENVFVSPLSVSMVLGMLLNGAAGETQSEIETALGLSALTLDEINRAYRDLIDLLLGLDRSVETRVANSIWIREGFPVVPEFLDTNREFFGAEVAGLDFDDPGSVERINGWVEEETNGRIKQIIDMIRPEHVMFLINAMYFKGLWQIPFDKDDTRPAPFRRADGSEVQVQMMTVDSLFANNVTDRYHAVDLPYGGGAFSMTIVLPAEGVATADLVAALDAPAWRTLIEGLHPQFLQVSLPRFELEYEKTLNETLQELGIRKAFGDADFSRLTPGGGVWLDYVKQKAFVKVDEAGTEAAAATVGAIAVSAPPPFLADRPFVFAIRERLSGTILFVGQVTDPSR
ncbi:MAG: serpin family protein [Gemmatimonadota bacterium]